MIECVLCSDSILQSKLQEVEHHEKSTQLNDRKEEENNCNLQQGDFENKQIV